MLNRIICYFKGHLRGKRVETVTHSDLSVEATMQCPRCKATWTRTTKAKAAA